MLTYTLKAKFNACWGKYRKTLAKFPLQKLDTPSCVRVLVTQSLTPMYLVSSLPCLSSSPWFCNSNFTLSIGAALVLETAAAHPESKKFSLNPRLVDFPFEEDIVIVTFDSYNLRDLFFVTLLLTISLISVATSA